MDVDEDIQTLINERRSASEIRAHAVSRGMRLLAQDGDDKVSQGITTLDEVMRVTRA